MPRLILLLLALCLSIQAATIRDTLRNPDGSAAVGKCDIQLFTPAHDATATYGTWKSTVDMTAIAAGITLASNDSLTPGGTSYQVRCYTATRTWSEFWVVPTSTSALRIADVRVQTVPSPVMMVLPSQIAPAGAMKGQALVWNGTRWAPGTVAGGGLSGAATWAQLEAGTAPSGSITGSSTWAQIEAQ